MSLIRRFFWSLLAAVAMGQVKPPPAAPPVTPNPVVSPEVHGDNSVTFRLKQPNAKSVLLRLEGQAKPIGMEKDEQGIWSTTTAPLSPDYYGYSFVADGVSLIDPSNWLLKPNFLNASSMLHVAGPASLPWELNDVAHGEVHHHFYHSAVAVDDRDFYVYTPPGYDSKTKTKEIYPALYLLHGYSDDASGWTAVGRANVILDNLIAQGKARPMIVVMPLGYGTMEILQRGGLGNMELRTRNFLKFREALLTEVMPQVESEYRINKDRTGRAIAGLSMGGAESLLTGLNAPDKFAWIGAFSSGGLPDDYAAVFPGLQSNKSASANDQQPRLLWIACGTEDGLVTANRNLRTWLKSKGVKATELETPGAHTWMVWRRNLVEFTSLLFR